VPHNIDPELTDLAVPFDSLSPYQDNARRHDLQMIVDSLRVNGQYRPVVSTAGPRPAGRTRILAGNGTWEAAKADGWDVIAATFVDVGEHQSGRIVLIDTRADDVVGYDAQGPRRAAAVPQRRVEGTGYDNTFLDALLEEMGNRALAGLPEDDGDEDEDPGAGVLLALADFAVGEPRHQPETRVTVEARPAPARCRQSGSLVGQAHCGAARSRHSSRVPVPGPRQSRAYRV